jgi:hypothetical protein
MKLPDRERCCAKRHLEMSKLATSTIALVLVRRFEQELCKCAVSGLAPRTDLTISILLNLFHLFQIEAALRNMTDRNYVSKL